MSFIGLIPARGGSKGIPNKNIVECAGQPLIVYTCRAALASARLDRIIVSTDDEKIASICRSYGVEVPFQRPPELALDDTSMVDVLIHALNWLENKNETVDAIVLLQPTSPLRQAAHIDATIDLFLRTNAQTVVTVMEVPHQFTPVSLMEMRNRCLVPYLNNAHKATRRQEKPLLYARNGPAVLVVKPDVIKSGRLYGDPTVGYVMESALSIDVDTMYDLRIAELLLAEKK